MLLHGASVCSVFGVQCIWVNYTSCTASSANTLIASCSFSIIADYKDKGMIIVTLLAISNHVIRA